MYPALGQLSQLTAVDQLCILAQCHLPLAFSDACPLCDPELSLRSFLLAAFHSLQCAGVLWIELQCRIERRRRLRALALCVQNLPAQCVSSGARVFLDAHVHVLKRLVVAFRFEQLAREIQSAEAPRPRRCRCAQPEDSAPPPALRR